MSIPRAWPAAALLAVTFSAGAMAGIAYDRHFVHRHDVMLVGSPQVMAHLTQQLQLDSAQQAAVSAIFARHQGAVDSVWRALQPHVGATLDSVHREMMAVLRPDQQALFLGMMKSMHGH